METSPPNNTAISRLYTIDELAAKVGLTKPTLYREMRMGNLPYTMVSQSRRFTYEQIQQWLENGFERTQIREVKSSQGQPLSCNLCDKMIGDGRWQRDATKSPERYSVYHKESESRRGIRVATYCPKCWKRVHKMAKALKLALVERDASADVH